MLPTFVGQDEAVVAAVVEFPVTDSVAAVPPQQTETLCAERLKLWRIFVNGE
jgi:hypothetical protein